MNQRESSTHCQAPRPLCFRLGDSEGCGCWAWPTLTAITSTTRHRSAGLHAVSVCGGWERPRKSFNRCTSSTGAHLERLEKEQVSDFDYRRYEWRVPTAEEILIEYIGGKLKYDPEISAVQQAFIAESGVTPVALELGLILLQHAQAQTDAQARKSLLDEAESTFLAVSRVAGDRADFQLSLCRCITGKGNTPRASGSSTRHSPRAAATPKLSLQAASVPAPSAATRKQARLAEEGFKNLLPARPKTAAP